MHVDLYIATVVKLAALMRLTAGVYAIQAPGVPMTVEKAAQYAIAATFHGTRAGIDPYELVAIARNESDFVETMTGPDGKDCGLTQTRVTITKFSCKQLRHSYWLAFQEAAREMKEYGQACRGHQDFDRCRLNHYNSGVRYARHGFHGAYWLRVACFADAARQGISVGQSCRRVHNRGDIARTLHRGIPRSRSLIRCFSISISSRSLSRAASSPPFRMNSMICLSSSRSNQVPCRLHTSTTTPECRAKFMRFMS